MIEVDLWWNRLSINNKEKVASWAEGIKIRYPFCTTVWNRLSHERKLEYRSRFNRFKATTE